MCGIAGARIRSPGLGREDLTRLATGMADALRHRGPDGSGTWTDPEVGVAFGHRRLNIIDLTETGRQPMVSASHRYVITHNGEIYNFRALRAELEALGVSFRGNSDTEVALEAIARWGLATAVKRFVGMFALALWDREARTLSLVRDRLGIKPLYYADLDGLFLFASELKALRACGRWQPELDTNALASFLRFNYVPAPHTIYRGVRKLEPGCILTLRDGAEARVERYWDLAEVIEGARENRDNIGDKEAVDELARVLSDAVEARLVADVPVGAFLSGGIDSTAVVALMRAHMNRPVRTFTIGFEEADLNEAGHASNVAAHLGIDHTELYVSPGEARDVIPRLAEIYDEPFADSSQIPVLLVSQMTRRHVTVALSGDGGDEVFGGYNRYMQGARLMPCFRYLPRGIRRLGAGALRSLPPRAWTTLFRAVPAQWRPSMAGDKLYKLAEVLAGDQDDFYRSLVSQWPSPTDIVHGAREPASPIDDRRLEARMPAFVERMQYLDTVTYLPDDILTKVDRASMATSLEARVPMLDHRVVAFAWGMPMRLKLRNGGGKWLLRRLLDRYVPRDLIDRPKAGFAVPLDGWLRGPLRDWGEDLLSERALEADGILDAAAVRSAWQAHLSGRQNLQEPLWCVLMFQTWKRRWLA